MQPRLRFLLLATAIVTRTETNDRVAIGSTSITLGTSVVVSLTRPVIHAEIIRMRRSGETRINGGSAVLFCQPAIEAKEVTGRAALSCGCLVEISAESSADFLIDGHVRHIESRVGSGLWFKIEGPSVIPSSP